MAIERFLEPISSVAFAADGGQDGVITLASTEYFKVKQTVVVSAISLSELVLEVKRVISPTKMIVGPKNTTGKFLSRADLSQYTIALLSTVRAEEQPKSKLPPNDITQAVYEQEPTVAIRTFSVDEFGNKYDTQNPLPVRLSDGSINIGSVNAELEVQLSHIDNDPDAGDVHDSVRIGDGVEQLEINPGGSINVNIVDGFDGTVTPIFNQITSVISNAWQTLVTYTVPVGKKGFLYRVNFGGDNIAEYEVLVNSVLISKARTWFSGPLFDKIEWSSPNGSGYQLAAGNVVTVRVQHWRPTVGTFEGTILMNIKDV